MELLSESKMAAILDFKMAAMQKSNFANNSKTKHDRKAISKATPRFWGSGNPMELLSEFQDGGHLVFFLFQLDGNPCE